MGWKKTFIFSEISHIFTLNLLIYADFAPFFWHDFCLRINTYIIISG